MTRAQLGTILEARHAEVEVAALERLFDRRPLHLDELRLASESVRDHARDLDVEATHLRRIRRIRLDERRAALGVAAPTKRRAADGLRVTRRDVASESGERESEWAPRFSRDRSYIKPTRARRPSGGIDASRVLPMSTHSPIGMRF